MFGTKKKEAPSPTQVEGRYRVEAVFTGGGNHEKMAANVEEAINAGDQRGWTLLGVTQHAAVVMLYFDTAG